MSDATKPTKWRAFFEWYPFGVATVVLVFVVALWFQTEARRAEEKARHEAFIEHYRAELLRVSDIVEKLWDIWGR